MNIEKLEAEKKPTNRKSFFVKSPKTPQLCKTIFTRTYNFLDDESFSEISDEYSFNYKPGSSTCGGGQEKLLNIQNLETKPTLATIYEDEHFEDEQSETLIEPVEPIKLTATISTIIKRKSSTGYFKKIKKKNLTEYNKFLIRKQDHFENSHLNLTIKKIKGKIDHLNNVICLQNTNINPSKLEQLQCSPVKIYSQYDLMPPNEIAKGTIIEFYHETVKTNS